MAILQHRNARRRLEAEERSLDARGTCDHVHNLAWLGPEGLHASFYLQCIAFFFLFLKYPVLDYQQHCRRWRPPYRPELAERAAMIGVPGVVEVLCRRPRHAKRLSLCSETALG